MLYVNYYRSMFDRQWELHFCSDSLSFPERNESVMIVPGSIAQMTADMLAQDDADLEYAARFDGYR